MLKTHALVAAFMLSTTLAGADALRAADDNPAAHRKPSPAGAAVRFGSLADGDTVPPTFTVRFEVEGMGIAPAGTDIPNTGHHHLLIDVDELPDPNQPLPASEHFVHFGKGQTETELTLAEGEHTLQLMFADYLHIPHNPVVISERVTITVSAAAD